MYYYKIGVLFSEMIPDDVIKMTVSTLASIWDLQVLDFPELVHLSYTSLKWGIACNFATFGFHRLFFICVSYNGTRLENDSILVNLARSSQFYSHSDWSFRKLSTSLVSIDFSVDSAAVCSGCSVPCQVSEELFFCFALWVESCNNQLGLKVGLAQLSSC